MGTSSYSARNLAFFTFTQYFLIIIHLGWVSVFLFTSATSHHVTPSMSLWPFLPTVVLQTPQQLKARDIRHSETATVQFNIIRTLSLASDALHSRSRLVKPVLFWRRLCSIFWFVDSTYSLWCSEQCIISGRNNCTSDPPSSTVYLYCYWFCTASNNCFSSLIIMLCCALLLMKRCVWLW